MTRARAAATVLSLAALVGCGTSTGHAGAAPSPRPTGQVDQITKVVGQLRSDLLAASVAHGGRGYPDPRHPIVIRSSLTVTGTAAPSRVLLVAFRSLSGRQCLGIAVVREGVPPVPPECLPSCREVICLVVYSGGPIPGGTRILAGRAHSRIDEIRVTAPSGAVRRYRVSRSRVGSPPAAPILAGVAGVRRVEAYGDGRELAWVRFLG